MSLVLHYPMANPNILPVEYLEIEYIEATGTLYIATDYYPNSNSSVELTYLLTVMPDSDHLQRLFGCRTSSSADMFLCCLTYSSSDGLYAAFSDKAYHKYNVADLRKHTITFSSTACAVDPKYGNLSLSLVYTAFSSPATFTSPRLLDIFSYSSGNNGATHNTKTYARIFNLKIWESGKLVRHYIPCYRKSDLVPGLFDIVNQKFFSSGNSDKLLPGPSVYSIPEPYEQVLYIEFPATYYIDTNLSIESGSTTWCLCGIRYQSESTGRDLLGYSTNNNGYFGVTAAGAWELHGDTTGNWAWYTSGTDIYKYCIVRYSNTASSTGSYLKWNVGRLGRGNTYSTRTKYISFIEIYKNSTIARKMVSCRRKLDGAIGMYDLIYDVFYPVSGGTEAKAFGHIAEKLEYNAALSVNELNYSASTTGAGSTISKLGYDCFKFVGKNVSNGLTRILNLGMNGYKGPWTISFIAWSTTNTSVSIDLCDAGYKNITITTTPLVFYITTSVTNYYTTSNINGFFDISGLFSSTIYIYGLKLLKTSKKVGLLWNLLANIGVNFIGLSANVTLLSDGSIQGNTNALYAKTTFNLVKGHKYYFKCERTTGSDYYGVALYNATSAGTNSVGSFNTSVPNTWVTFAKLFTAVDDNLLWFGMGLAASFNVGYRNVVLVDLTRMYGEGLEPTQSAFETFLAGVPSLAYTEGDAPYDTTGGVGNTFATYNNISYNLLRSAYDSEIYVEPDGSRWIRIGYHNNPSSTDRLFASTSDFTKPVLKATDIWCDFTKFYDVKDRWEILVKQKATSSSAEVKYRWILYKNPMEATFADIHNKVVNITTSGYTNPGANKGGLFALKGNNYLAFDNNSNGANWYGFACKTLYNGGYPAYGSVVVTTGSESYFLRIDDVIPCYKFNSGYILHRGIINNLKSASFWVKFDDLTQNLVIFADATSKMSFGVYTSGIIVSCNGTSKKVFNKSSLVANKWYHIALVYETPALYINGVSIADIGSTDGWTHPRDFLIGCRHNTTDTTNAYFKGELLDFRLYDHNLTQAEVTAIYNERKL